jgi:hypothetical protein
MSFDAKFVSPEPVDFNKSAAVPIVPLTKLAAAFTVPPTKLAAVFTVPPTTLPAVSTVPVIAPPALFPKDAAALDGPFTSATLLPSSFTASDLPSLDLVPHPPLPPQSMHNPPPPVLQDGHAGHTGGTTSVFNMYCDHFV